MTAKLSYAGSGILFALCLGLSYGIDLGKDGCLISRLDVIPCTYRNPKSTKTPGSNEYGIYSTRFGQASSGGTNCGIRKRRHRVLPIGTIGDSNKVFTLFSPGISIDPPEKYGNQMLVNYSIQCPDGHLAFFDITNIDLEEANCFHAARNSMRCVDYLRVSRGGYGSTEYCGKEIDQSDSANRFEFGTFTILFRTSPKSRFGGFRASVICFDPAPASKELPGCTVPAGSENSTMANSSRRKKRDIQESEREWLRKMSHLQRVRRQVEEGEFNIRFLERNVSFGINVTYNNKELNFIAVENGSEIDHLRLGDVDVLFTFDRNGELDEFRESAKSESGVVLPLPGPGPMIVVGRYAYFRLFVIDPRGLVPSMEEMEVIANLTEAQFNLNREDNSSRFSDDFLDPPFNTDDLGLPNLGRRRKRSLQREAVAREQQKMPRERRRRQAMGVVEELPDAIIMEAIQNENACNPVLRSSARATLQQADSMSPGRVGRIRNSI